MATVVQQRRPAANATRAQARKVKKSKMPVRAGVLCVPNLNRSSGFHMKCTRMVKRDTSQVRPLKTLARCGRLICYGSTIKNRGVYSGTGRVIAFT